MTDHGCKQGTIGPGLALCTCIVLGLLLVAGLGVETFL